MVLITDRNEVTTVYFPKNIPDNVLPEDVTVELSIYSELSQRMIAIDPDNEKVSNIVYVFDLTDIIDDLEDGEYTYSLIGVSEEGLIDLGKGLLRIGNLKYDPKKTNNKAKTIIQYGG